MPKGNFRILGIYSYDKGQNPLSQKILIPLMQGRCLPLFEGD
jgi:hypothetical protein